MKIILQTEEENVALKNVRTIKARFSARKLYSAGYIYIEPSINSKIREVKIKEINVLER
jgi:hypothetical protein